MLRQIGSVGRSELGMTRLSGLEISGLVLVLICAGVLAWIMPELIRYIKIRHM